MVNRNPNRNGRRNNRNAISNVRVVDEFSGSAGARLDRMIAAVQNSHSQTRVICGDYFGVNSSTTAATPRVISGQDIFATDDFTSLASQFETYRVTAIRFDVYALQPQTGYSAFSTFHDDTLGRHAVFNIDQVIDGPDSQVPTYGQGKIVFTWMATGSTELEFLPTANVATNASDFGGLRLVAAQSATAATPLFEVIMKAVVDFRGRT